MQVQIRAHLAVSNHRNFSPVCTIDVRKTVLVCWSAKTPQAPLTERGSRQQQTKAVQASFTVGRNLLILLMIGRVGWAYRFCGTPELALSPSVSPLVCVYGGNG